jgi:hypothetical protein
MSEVKIKRRQRNVSITLSTSTSSATTLRLDDMAGAVLSMGTVSTNASTLHIYAADAEDGSYRRLYDNAGSPANITLAASSTEGHAYSFPDAAFAVPWCKVVSGDTNSTGVAAVVTFKS